jgi:hypothetical protein
LAFGYFERTDLGRSEDRDFEFNDEDNDFLNLFKNGSGSSVPIPEFGEYLPEREGGGFFSRLFLRSYSKHAWARYSGVSGHLRMSSKGKIHYVRSHSRNTGEFWNWAAWTPLSWVVFPIIFLKLQQHHSWKIQEILWHSFFAAIGSLLADLALILTLFFLGVWLIIKVWNFF